MLTLLKTILVCAKSYSACPSSQVIRPGRPRAAVEPPSDRSQNAVRGPRTNSLKAFRRRRFQKCGRGYISPLEHADANYGFAAIDHRYAVLAGASIRIPEPRRLDLSPLFQQIYGSQYIDNPKLVTLARKNSITMERFLMDAKEASPFERKDYVALHQSTLRKVDNLHTLAELAYRGTLVTNASW
jgi:hypothetical protein